MDHQYIQQQQPQIDAVVIVKIIPRRKRRRKRTTTKEEMNRITILNLNQCICNNDVPSFPSVIKIYIYRSYYCIL
jgi:hypothetical protein